VGRPLLWILLTVLAITVALAALYHNEGPVVGDLDSGDIVSLAWNATLVVLLAGAVIAMFRTRFMQALQAALLWLLIGLVVVVGYAYRFELRDVGDRVLSELMPGYASSRANVVEIARGGGGSFPVRAEVNGARVAMILDTGATAVVLTQEAAKAAGLPIEVLSYTVPVETANGRTRAASVTLDRLAVGGIVERSVPALIAQPGQLRVSLLGMTFLNRLEGWEVRGDKLVLRGYP
jgi:aspartyl protease family protein